MVDWFFDRQIRIALIIGSICLAIIFLLDFRGFQAIATFIVSLFLIFLGSKFYVLDTAENWFKFSYFDLIKKAVGGVLMFFGWVIFLRRILALAIASIILKLD